MKITPKQLNDLIRIISENVYIADPPSSLGRVAFSPQRQHEDGVPFEENLTIEQEILDEIENYIKVSGSSLSANISQTILNIIESNEYNDVILRPKSNEYIFRGLALSQENMEDICDQIGLNIDELDAGEEYNGRFYFKPLPGILTTSWTKVMRVAEEFSWIPGHTIRPEGKTYGIVLAAKAGDNPGKFLDLQRLYRIARSTDYREESEAIGFGDIKIDGFVIIDIV